MGIIIEPVRRLQHNTYRRHGLYINHANISNSKSNVIIAMPNRGNKINPLAVKPIINDMYVDRFEFVQKSFKYIIAPILMPAMLIKQTHISKIFYKKIGDNYPIPTINLVKIIIPLYTDKLDRRDIVDAIVKLNKSDFRPPHLSHKSPQACEDIIVPK